VDFSGAILDAIANNNFDSLNFSSLFSEISPKEREELLKLADPEDPTALMTAMGLSTEVFDTIGYNGAVGFTTAFKLGMEEWKLSDYIDAANKAGEEAAEKFEVDLDQFKAYRALLLDAHEAYEDNVEGLNAVALANSRL
jgi:hypothetical protein